MQEPSIYTTPATHIMSKSREQKRDQDVGNQHPLYTAPHTEKLSVTGEGRKTGSVS